MQRRIQQYKKKHPRKNNRRSAKKIYYQLLSTIYFLPDEKSNASSISCLRRLMHDPGNYFSLSKMTMSDKTNAKIKANVRLELLHDIVNFIIWKTTGTVLFFDKPANSHWYSEFMYHFCNNIWKKIYCTYDVGTSEFNQHFGTTILCQKNKQRISFRPIVAPEKRNFFNNARDVNQEILKTAAGVNIINPANLTYEQKKIMVYKDCSNANKFYPEIEKMNLKLYEHGIQNEIIMIKRELNVASRKLSKKEEHLQMKFHKLTKAFVNKTMFPILRLQSRALASNIEIDFTPINYHRFLALQNSIDNQAEGFDYASYYSLHYNAPFDIHDLQTLFELFDFKDEYERDPSKLIGPVNSMTPLPAKFNKIAKIKLKNKISVIEDLNIESTKIVSAEIRNILKDSDDFPGKLPAMNERDYYDSGHYSVYFYQFIDYVFKKWETRFKINSKNKACRFLRIPYELRKLNKNPLLEKKILLYSLSNKNVNLPYSFNFDDVYDDGMNTIDGLRICIKNAERTARNSKLINKDYQIRNYFNVITSTFREKCIFSIKMLFDFFYKLEMLDDNVVLVFVRSFEPFLNVKNLSFRPRKSFMKEEDITALIDNFLKSFQNIPNIFDIQYDVYFNDDKYLYRKESIIQYLNTYGSFFDKPYFPLCKLEIAIFVLFHANICNISQNLQQEATSFFEIIYTAANNHRIYCEMFDNYPNLFIELMDDPLISSCYYFVPIFPDFVTNLVTLSHDVKILLPTLTLYYYFFIYAVFWFNCTDDDRFCNRNSLIFFNVFIELCKPITQQNCENYKIFVLDVSPFIKSFVDLEFGDLHKEIELRMAYFNSFLTDPLENYGDINLKLFEIYFKSGLISRATYLYHINQFDISGLDFDCFFFLIFIFQKPSQYVIASYLNSKKDSLQNIQIDATPFDVFTKIVRRSRLL